MIILNTQYASKNISIIAKIRFHKVLNIDVGLLQNLRCKHSCQERPGNFISEFYCDVFSPEDIHWTSHPTTISLEINSSLHVYSFMLSLPELLHNKASGSLNLVGFHWYASQDSHHLGLATLPPALILTNLKSHVAYVVKQSGQTRRASNVRSVWHDFMSIVWQCQHSH